MLLQLKIIFVPWNGRMFEQLIFRAVNMNEDVFKKYQEKMVRCTLFQAIEIYIYCVN